MRQPNRPLRRLAAYALAYLLLGVSALLSIVVGVALRRTWLLAMAVFIHAPEKNSREIFSYWATTSGIDNIGRIILGLAFVIVVMVLEDDYRTAAGQGRLWRKFLPVTAVELAIIGAASGLGLVFIRLLGAPIAVSDLIALIALPVAGLCWWSRR